MGPQFSSWNVLDSLNSNMLSVLCTCSVIVSFAATTLVSAKVFKVGDHLGWREPDGNNSEFYTLWAAKNSFHVGDSLRFVYKNDSVLVVEKWEYYHCATGKPIFAFDNGRNVVHLDRPGPFYFIGGTSSRCKNGQRLLVDVISPVAPSPHRSSAPVTLGSVSIALVAPFLTMVFCALYMTS